MRQAKHKCKTSARCIGNHGRFAGKRTGKMCMSWKQDKPIKEASQIIHRKLEHTGRICPQHSSQKHCWSKQMIQRKHFYSWPLVRYHYCSDILLGQETATHQNVWNVQWGFLKVPLHCFFFIIILLILWWPLVQMNAYFAEKKKCPACSASGCQALWHSLS